jgi:hypothetical protein
MLKKYADGRPVGYPIYLLPSRKADIKRDGHPSRQLHLPHARIELPGIILICGSLLLRHARFFVWVTRMQRCNIPDLKGSLEYVEA